MSSRYTSFMQTNVPASDRAFSMVTADSLAARDNALVVVLVLLGLLIIIGTGSGYI